MKYKIRTRARRIFLSLEWDSEVLPRVGEQIMLPDDPDAEDWMDCEVLRIEHFPDRVDVWIDTGLRGEAAERVFSEAKTYRSMRA